MEECLSLDASELLEDGLLGPDMQEPGLVVFEPTGGGSNVNSADYEVNTVELPGWIRLAYIVVGPGERVDYVIRLAATGQHFGGLRWWFLCPLVVNGKPCRHRVGKLYLPPGARYLGCRDCYGLTYRSRQESNGYRRAV